MYLAVMDDDKKPECTDGDTVTVIGPQVNGVVPCIRHQTDHRVVVGFAKVHDPEKPVSEESVYFKHREGNLYDVIPASAVAATSSGPAQVATTAYRSGWDIAFGGKKAPVGQA